MRRIRFTISSLLITVVIAGFSFAALREANEIWDSSVFSITVVVLLISILIATHGTEKRRAFCLGFALFGWAYLALSLIPSIESSLITTKALAYLASRMPRLNPGGFGYIDLDNDGSMDLIVVNKSQPNSLVSNTGNGDSIADVTASARSRRTRFTRILARRSLTGFGTTENFIRIGHSLLALIIALLGGYLSRRLHNDNRAVIERAATPQGSTSSKRSGG
jgi:hypothetical protein